MLNNYWEEQEMYKDLLEYHEQEMGKMKLPQWIIVRRKE